MKRIIDIFGAQVGLIFLSPLFLFLIVIIRLCQGPPVFFTQIRPGLHGDPFRMVKFRTMVDSRDEAGNLRPDAQRLTTVGRFLRTTSLDELPELWNVLKGDMSLVGPRPLLMEYLSFYNENQRRRHEVRPGITGWAQVNGRNSLSWEEKFALDVWYVDNQSLSLDLKILLMTVCKVIKRDGISEAGEATMTKFTGTQDKFR